MTTIGSQPESEDVSVTSALRNLDVLSEAQSDEDALALADAVLARTPAQREALYGRALSLRRLGRTAEALAALETLRREHPRFGSADQERGLCLLALGDEASAREAFARAVTLNPWLATSFENLAQLHADAGDETQARLLADRAAHLRKAPPDVARANVCLGDGDEEAAKHGLDAFIAREGRHVEALLALARLAQRRRALGDAESLLREAVEAAPSHLQARLERTRLLVARQNYPAALAALAGLSAPPEAAFLRATALAGLGRHEEALAIFESLLAQAPSPQLTMLRGHALRALGRTEEAIACYRNVATSAPLVGDAYWSLANLKSYLFDEAEIERMVRLDQSPALRVADHIQLSFALGKAFEGRAKYARAFACYSRANAAQRRLSPYRPAIAEDEARRARETFNRAFFAARPGSGVDADDPLFVVGLPRSGSTLIEQILAAHPQVDATQELNELPRLVADLNGSARNYPERLASFGPQDFSALGRRYLEETRPYRRGRPRFVDKMPNNFWHVGLIRLMLPNARVIDMRRAPMACGFSNFKQFYPQGQQFSYSFEDFAHYHAQYLRLMRHWDDVAPGFVLTLAYEEVVEDLEGSVRRLLDFCGLAFDPSCLAFHKQRRAVATPSSEQVRRPLFRDGLDAWRPFELWLAPLKEALRVENPR